jgi:DNA-directed RNA polymerase specialized sigma24 family protein
MSIFKWFRQEEEGKGAPPPAGDRAQITPVQTSGVRPRPPAEGPCTSFEETYHRHLRLIWSLILHEGIDRHAAPDVVQNVCLRLHLRILDNHGVVPYPVTPVVIGLVEDEVRNTRRGRTRRREAGEPDDDMPTSKPGAEERLGNAELAKKIADFVLARMSEGDRALITMAHAELSIQDIAAARGSTVDAAWIALKRARQRFVELGKVWYELHDGSGGP